MEQHPGSETNRGENFRTYFFAAAIAGLLFFLLYRFDFEPGSPLTKLLPLLFGVFLVHFWLPARFGMPFLALSACAGAFVLLGPVNAVALIVLLVAFTILIRLPISFRAKLLLAIGFVAALFVARTGVVRVPFVTYAIPVAGSMLMFRAALVLYEHQYSKTKPTFIQDFTYLFLAPNLALPLFAIVDYKTFLRNYSARNAETIRQGLSRITLAIVQLMAHRFLYIYVTPPPSQVHDASTAALYITTSYLGILHFTGLLWLGAGFLGLFGFRLPDAFNNVFLVDSFGAIWRRINIYWREFVVKLVYYPVYFRLRKKTSRAVLFSALIAFSFTAMLHGWQWFWLLGMLTTSVTGLIYWLILGTCISLVLAREERRPPKPDIHTPGFAALKTLRIMGMFLFMSMTWSLWGCASFGDWFHLLSHFREGGMQDWLKITGIAGLIFTGGTIAWLIFWKQKTATGKKYSWLRPLLAGVVLLPLTFVSFRQLLPENLQRFSDKLALPRLNADDQNDATENYYDQMLASDGSGTRPWQMKYRGKNARSGLDEACTRRKDMVGRELIPSRTTDIGTWTIVANRYGMRDKEYVLEKTPGTFRIAILGGSYEMGSGVAQDSVFENQLERMLRDSFPGKNIEVLNFAVGGYHLPQQVWVMQEKVARFQPDLVLCFVHPADSRRNSNYLSLLVRNNADLIYPELYAVRDAAGAKQNMGPAELKNRFEPFHERVTRWSLRSIEHSCDSIGAKLTVVYLPSLQADAENVTDYSGPGGYLSGTDCGFISLQNVFAGDVNRYRLRNDPSHPNAYGHLLVAKKLSGMLTPALRNPPK